MAVLFRQPQLSLYCANDPDLRNAPENTRNAVSREPLIQPDDDSNDDQRQLRPQSETTNDDQRQLRPQSETTNDDVRLLRPQSMNEMIGQRDVYERLKIAVDAADKRDDTLGHILLDGPPGLGKTTFALCIPRDLGVPVQLTSGPALSAPKDLVPYLTNASERSILFIDEIHRLPTAVEEYLYTAMEDYRVDIVHGEGTNARTLNLWLKPFTLIGATTRAGLLSAPLRDRFPLREHLDFYETDEIGTIVHRSAAIFHVEIDDQSCQEIAHKLAQGYLQA